MFLLIYLVLNFYIIFPMIKKKVTEYGFIDLRLNGDDFSKGERVSGQVYIGLTKVFPGN